MYVLLLVTTQAFLGQYNSLDSCNKAIRRIYEKQVISLPELYTKEQIAELQKVVDIQVQYNTQYVCVKR